MRKFLRLTRPDRGLVLSAALLLGAIRLGLWLLPFRKVRRVVVLLTRVSALLRNDHPTPPERIAWAVTRAAAYVPGATCLVQALAAQALLEQRGLPARLRIGIGRTDDAELRGHAWVDSDGMVVVGGGEVLGYSVLCLPQDDGR